MWDYDDHLWCMVWLLHVNSNSCRDWQLQPVIYSVLYIKERIHPGGKVGYLWFEIKNKFTEREDVSGQFSIEIDVTIKLYEDVESTA